MNAGLAFKLSHLQAMLLFAVVISMAFGFLGKRRPADRVKYIAWTLFLFLLVGVGIGWAMYPFSH
jgi:cytochrome bd-type quinol oxidase subunit 2